MIDIQEFIFRALIEYSNEGSQLFKEFGKDYDKLPLILVGDFNTNFKDKNSEPLKTFLHEKFNLLMNNDPEQSTTKSHTTIDAVFRDIWKICNHKHTSLISVIIDLLYP